MIKRANRESRPVPSPSCRTPSSVCRTFNRATPHFVITPRRPRGVAVATTAAPETRLADLHARGNTPATPFYVAPLFPRISSNVSPLSRPHPRPLTAARFIPGLTWLSLHHSPSPSHRRFIDDAAALPGV